MRQGHIIAASRWEPDEPRDSCPDLGGRGGEIPPRYSTPLSSYNWCSTQIFAIIAVRRQLG
jgi:hypothetical protein